VNKDYQKSSNFSRPQLARSGLPHALCACVCVCNVGELDVLWRYGLVFGTKVAIEDNYIALDGSPTVDSSKPNVVCIGATCRPRGTKNIPPD